MYHFIGIKGSGMSALAQIMYELGFEIQGSDVDKSFFTEIGLKERKIPTFIYNKNNINKNMEIVVGNSIKEDHEELIKAKELGLTIYSYQEMIGKIIKNYTTIAVSGCHGKTTTTAMFAHVLNNIIGCNYLIGDGTGYANKDNKFFVLEACEYQRHFLAYFAKYIIITNIELDHVDYYKDIDDFISAFSEFTNNGEIIVAWGDDPHTRSLNTAKDIYFYGLGDNNQVVAKNIDYKTTETSFDVYINNELYQQITIPLAGKHNVLNSLAVITICYLENLDKELVKNYLKTLPGAKRRFSERIINGCVLIDDYAHHPTEINATIDAAKQKYPDKKIVAVFQPHTFSRTKTLARDYIKVLAKADNSFVLDLHPSREKQEDYPEVSSYLIIDNLDTCEYITMEQANKLLPYKNAVILFMGANDLSKIENDLIELLKKDL